MADEYAGRGPGTTPEKREELASLFEEWIEARTRDADENGIRHAAAHFFERCRELGVASAEVYLYVAIETMRERNRMAVELDAMRSRMIQLEAQQVSEMNH
jgi:hypothetical protein